MFGVISVEVSKEHDVDINSIELIGSHGQTIWLLSMPKNGNTRWAFCLGEGSVISGITGITAVTDFRQCEQAEGRQGAPLVALVDGILLHCLKIGKSAKHRGHCEGLLYPTRKRRWCKQDD